jgi:hypothetical protein
MNIDKVSTRLGGICPASSAEFRPMSESEVLSIERQLGASLPESYRSMLTEFGAFKFKGRSEDSPFIFFKSIDRLPDYIAVQGLGLIRWFYGVDEGAQRGLRQQIRDFQDRIPATMIPIASDGGAGQICIGINGEDSHRIFYWDMANEPLDEETYLEDYGEPMPSEAKRQNVHLVATSFEDFLNQLVVEP